MPQVTFNGTKINVEFTESSSRQQLNSGENISTLFGKIKKIFSDLKAVCFSGSYNDLSNKPSSLPANGGNADTVDGMHADEFAKSTNPIINGDMIFERDSSKQTVSAVYSVSDMLVLRNANKDDLSSRCDVMISIDGVRIVTDTQNFKIGDGGNADTVGGKVPEKIFYDNGLAADLNDATQSGCYATSPDTLNVPFSAWWLVDTMNFNNQFIVQKAHIIGSPTNMSYIRNYANDVWSEWQEIPTMPTKSTIVSGTTDANSNIFVFPVSSNKIPFIAFYYNCLCVPVALPDGSLCIHITAVDGTNMANAAIPSMEVFYVER